MSPALDDLITFADLITLAIPTTPAAPPSKALERQGLIGWVRAEEGQENDALTKGGRRYLHWPAGRRARIKHRYRCRERHEAPNPTKPVATVV